jgi:hypothetical protein
VDAAHGEVKQAEPAEIRNAANGGAFCRRKEVRRVGTLLEKITGSTRAKGAAAVVAGVAVVVALVGVVLIAGGEDQGPGDVETPSELSVEEVYRRVDEALVQSGRIYHAETDSEGTSIVPFESSGKRWVDASSQLAREEMTFEYKTPDGPQSHETTTIHRPDASFVKDDDRVSERRPLLCYGATLAASMVLGCPGALEKSTTNVAEGSYDGIKAILLIREGTSRGSDENFTFTQRLYLDAKTYLPIALESKGEVEYGQRQPTSEKRTYKTSWLDRSSLSADFFEPAAIGYAPPDPQAAIRNATDLQIYWLGREFSAPNVERLILKSSVAAPVRGVPYRYSLTYVRASNPHDPPFLTLQIFFRDIFERVSGQIPAGQVVIIGDMVVFFVPVGNGILTPEGLEQLKQGLVPYP